MKLNPDFYDMLKLFHLRDVRYLIVGAYAYAYYVEPRSTKDIDVWVDPSRDNAVRLYNALAEFGAPLEQVTVDDFMNPDLVYQIGLPPNRIDILMGIEGLEFESAWQRKIITQYGDIPTYIIHLDDLIVTKRLSGRSQDLEDLKGLEMTKKRKKNS